MSSRQSASLSASGAYGHSALMPVSLFVKVTSAHGEVVQDLDFVPKVIGSHECGLLYGAPGIPLRTSWVGDVLVLRDYLPRQAKFSCLCPS